MSKILKNTTGSDINISDTGVTIVASGQYTIPATDYLLWTASDNIITEIGSGDVVVNDGSSDLSISDGVDLIKGIYSKEIVGNTDGTPIGNTEDALNIFTKGSGAICSTNSTTTPLTSGATFTGSCSQNFYPQVGVMVKTDQDGVMYFDFSGDGVNWDSTYPVNGFVVKANIYEFHTAVKLGRYFRVRYVNGTDGDQTYIRLNTYYGEGFVPTSSPINQSINRDNDAIVVRSTIPQDEIGLKLRNGVRSVAKYGYRSDLSSAGGDQTVWATTGNFTPMTSGETFTVQYTNTSDGSGTTGALAIYFNYLDSNGIYKEALHVLGSTGSDVTSFSGIGINRVLVVSSGSSNVNVGDILITATTSGTTQGILPANKGSTQQCIYHVASDARAIIKQITINALRLGGGGGSPKIRVRGIAYRRSVDCMVEGFNLQIDTSSENTVQLTDNIGIVLEPGDVIYFTADTDTNSTELTLRFSLNEYEDN